MSEEIHRAIELILAVNAQIFKLGPDFRSIGRSVDVDCSAIAVVPKDNRLQTAVLFPFHLRPGVAPRHKPPDRGRGAVLADVKKVYETHIHGDRAKVDFFAKDAADPRIPVLVLKLTETEIVTFTDGLQCAPDGLIYISEEGLGSCTAAPGMRLAHIELQIVLIERCLVAWAGEAISISESLQLLTFVREGSKAGFRWNGRSSGT